VIVGDAKMIAKTLTVSDAMQGFPDVVVSPLFVIFLMIAMARLILV
jgi:hypothetical protein